MQGALLAVGRKEPDAHCAGNHALAEGDEKGVVPQQREEDNREAPVQNVARRRAPPAPGLAGLGRPIALLGSRPPDRARGPLVIALPRRVVRAIRDLIRCEGLLWSVGVRHLRQQVGGAPHPNEDPDAAHDSLANRHQQHGGCVAEELGCDLVEGDRQPDSAPQAADQDEPNGTQGPNDVGANLQRVAGGLAGHGMAVRALGLHHAIAVAELPAHLRVGGEAPDGRSLVGVPRVVRVAAVVIRGAGGIVEPAVGVVLRGEAVWVRRLGIPSLARVEVSRSRLHAAVVRAIVFLARLVRGGSSCDRIVRCDGPTGDQRNTGLPH
mmetsp:Transcript_11922/g.32723  ORF Transcript_11922/g.32723 Transcript_11922/m.32723 type:complete len:323 (+) Transcript_11922:815-1783(+)